MDEVITFLKDYNLCLDDGFFNYISDKVDFINPALYELAGCYEKDGIIRVKIPKILDIKMGSVAIHELGHLYDSYLSNQIMDSENTALLWEFTYLKRNQQIELLQSRIDEIERQPESLKYKSLQKVLTKIRD